MKRVCLLALEQAAVIVRAPSGVQYWNRSGHSDARFQAEGILVPISNDPPADQPELSLCTRLQAITGAAESITPAMARQINELLYEVSSSDALSVEATLLSASSHSWVYIAIRPQGEFSYFAGFGREETGTGAIRGEPTLQGVLTWPCRG